MILTQTWTLLVDAYRELNTKKLFWITMGLSGLVVVAFALIGNNAEGLTIAGYTIEIPFLSTAVIPTETLYKLTFTNLGISIWLSWIATVLALVSTSSMFPDFIAGGSIETTLSKPISRGRLFLTKYFTGLLFVGLQVAVFTGASFLVIGIRGGAWEPSLFLAIPVVLAFFSYLFGVCVLLGVVTRSTIASLLLTLLFWFFLFCLNTTDVLIQQLSITNQVRLESIPARIERAETRARAQYEANWRKANAPEGATKEEVDALEAPEPTAEDLTNTSESLGRLRDELASVKKNRPRWNLASDISFGVKTVFPKTQETVALLERWMVDFADLPQPPEQEAQDFGPMAGVNQAEVSKRLQAEMRSRSVWWVMGTSFIFEGVVLLLAMRIFKRRDF
jgi:ABC-type transport system involved in multi-copper enzyme maturation permease subunit